MKIRLLVWNTKYRLGSVTFKKKFGLARLIIYCHSVVPFILFCGGFLKALVRCFVFINMIGKLWHKLVLRVLGHNSEISSSIWNCLKVVILDVPFHCVWRVPGVDLEFMWNPGERHRLRTIAFGTEQKLLPWNISKKVSSAIKNTLSLNLHSF